MNFAKKIHLRPNEEIITVIRAGFLPYLWQYFFGILFVLASFFFMFWLLAQGWWGNVLFGFGIFIGSYICFRTWFYHHFNLLIVTTERIVDVNRLSWFDEVVSAAGWLDIKDIFVRRRGIWANLFDYGLITIETKSQQAVLELNKIKQPQKMQTLLEDLWDRYKQDKKKISKSDIYNEFIHLLPNLSEEELCEIKDLVEENLAAFTEEEIEEEGMSVV